VDREGDHDADLDITSERAPNYLSWVSELCLPHFGHRVLEVGAGHGAITARSEQGGEVVASDVSPPCVAALRKRFAGRPNVRIEDLDLRGLELDERFDSVLMVNVLQHIPDDVGALRGLSRLLVPGGNVVVYVPALTGLYGALDKTIGHDQRYSVWRLGEVFRRPNWNRSSFAGSTSSRSRAGLRSDAATSTIASAAASSRGCGIAWPCRPGASSRRAYERRSG
jgi:SAM-dependent methyltransferase